MLEQLPQITHGGNILVPTRGLYICNKVYLFNRILKEHKIPTLTMFANAKEGELNHSLNPTFISSSHTGSRIMLACPGGAFLKMKLFFN